MSRYPLFDRSALLVRPLGERTHDLDLGVVSPLPASASSGPDAEFEAVARRMLEAREKGAAVLFMMGAHVIRAGMQRYIVDLMERGLVTLLAGNGACAIHDWEFARIGATTESVARYIRDGRFGLWEETGLLNEVIADGVRGDLGLGESVGRAVWEGSEADFPYKGASLYAHAWRLGIPFTTHVGIGYDITHEHPNCDGAIQGRASYTDFLIYAAQAQRLEGGAVLAFGSAVMAPEVYLKALAMARNVAEQKGAVIRDVVTLVCDLRALPVDVSKEAPKTTPEYYFRPYKTMLVRTVADGGRSQYVQGAHHETIPRLWAACRRLDG